MCAGLQGIGGKGGSCSLIVGFSPQDDVPSEYKTYNAGAEVRKGGGGVYRSRPSLSISSMRKSMSDWVAAWLETTIRKKLTLLP